MIRGLCACSGDVELQRVQAQFCSRWLTGGPVPLHPNSDNAAVVASCSVCMVNDVSDVPATRISKDVSNVDATTGKRKKKSKGRLLSFVKKRFQSLRGADADWLDRADESDTPSNGNAAEGQTVEAVSIPEVYICLTCTACFCRKHMKDHNYSQRTTAGATSGPGMRHVLYFGVPSAIYLRGCLAAATSGSTIMPTLVCDKENELLRDAADSKVTLSLAEVTELKVSVASRKLDWRYSLMCVGCGLFYSLSDGEWTNTEPQARMRDLGQLFAKLLYLRARSVAVDVPPAELCEESSAISHHQPRRPPHLYSMMDMQRTYKATESYGVPTLPSVPVVSSSEHHHAMPTVIASAADRSKTKQYMLRAGVDGIDNDGNSCYFNSVVQCLLRCRHLTRSLLLMPSRSMPGPLTASFRGLVRQSKLLSEKDMACGALSKRARSTFKELCRLQPQFDNDEQQDAQELYLSLVNGIAEEFDRGKSEEEKQRGFRVPCEGATETLVICSRCRSTGRRQETFMVLSVPVEASLEDGLRHVLRPMRLTGKNKYACEECFKLLLPDQQAKHNNAVRAANEAMKRAKQQGKRVSNTGDTGATEKANGAAGTPKKKYSSSSVQQMLSHSVDRGGSACATYSSVLEQEPAMKPSVDEGAAAEEKSLNCVYSDADVVTSISRLGGLIVFHFLRFQFDGREFRKNYQPVSVPFSLDLFPFVSPSVQEAYRRHRPASSVHGRAAPRPSRSGSSPDRPPSGGPKPSSASSGRRSPGVARELVNGETPADNRNNSFTDFEDISSPSLSPRRDDDDCVTRAAPLVWGVSASERGSAAAQHVSQLEATEIEDEEKDLGMGTAPHAHYLDASSSSFLTEYPRATAMVPNRERSGDVAPDTSGRRNTKGPLPSLSLRRRLVGVVIHRGSLLGGHYVAFVRNLAMSSVWFRCDDEFVELVDEATVARASGEAYLVFYE